MAGGTVDVAVIVPTRNRPQLLDAAIGSILRGGIRPAELIVVDQSDAPHPTLDRHTSRPSEIRYIKSSSRGVGAARNEGMRAARSDVLALVDDDIRVDHHWLEALVARLPPPEERCVLSGKVVPADVGSFVPSTIVEEAETIHEGTIARDVLYSGNMALHRAALDEVGCFDPRLGAGARFPSATDNDLGFRLLRAGYRILYAPDVVVYHFGGRAGTEYLRLLWRYGHGQGAFFAKHAGLRDPHTVRRLVKQTGKNARRAVGVVPRTPEERLGHAAEAAGLAYGFSRWLVTERMVPRTRAALRATAARVFTATPTRRT